MTKDGSAHWALVSGNPIYNSHGNLIAAHLVLHDITERKRAEKALRETKDFLENLINYANVPIIVWDSQFHINRFNHAFESLTGRTAGEVIGKNLEILFPPALIQSSMKLIKKTLYGERWETVEINILHTGGSIHTVLWNSANIVDS